MAAKTILLILALFVVSNYGAPTAMDPGSFVSAHAIQPKHMTMEEHIQSVIDFWTEEKFRQAKSPWDLYPEKFNGSKMAHRQLDDARLNADGLPFVVNPVAALADPNMRAPAGVFGRPTTGKVFWHLGNNYYGMCSASVVASNNKDLLVTAGHCAFDSNQGGFLVNHQWVFVPGYQHGQRPYGSFPVRSMTSFTGWTNSNDFNYDVAFVLMAQVNGRHVQDAVGGQGIGFNFGRGELIFAFGYPLNLEGGEVMQYCRAHAGRHPEDGAYRGQRLPCDMTGGSSGGPWLQLYDTNSGVGYVTSVNSFVISGVANAMHGPNFGDDTRSLYDSMKN